ncbi:MAG: hypothetical protein Q4P20_09445 [Eubacteriales bacterium]|nr:hypothetical protein [Eubacteriales bacterium]
MAKFCGKIGYAETVETEPGLWEENITEKPYYGDLIQNARKLQNSGGVNDDINLANKISIVADPYAINHFYSMRYVEFMGAKWKISNVDVQYPRLILTVGGVWNGESS